jgi:hypothetical protein
MDRNSTGTYYISAAGGEKFQAFIPAPLPPIPFLVLDAVLINALADASLAIGRLNSLRLAPDYNLFLYQYVRKPPVSGKMSPQLTITKIPCPSVCSVGRSAFNLFFRAEAQRRGESRHFPDTGGGFYLKPNT